MMWAFYSGDGDKAIVFPGQSHIFNFSGPHAGVICQVYTDSKIWKEILVVGVMRKKNKVYKINLHMVIWDAIMSIMTSL